ncbi:hypothetical protein [Bacillus sp. V5-8f]|uniref:hypothetical protein n=1 Tax=Bacillus sp. V5-8f TaxID=2053044 RepID=UPI0015E07D80|nr:hypothetical protein [Bacillus sp. V5-8f]
MKKFAWILSGFGALLIIGSVFYPMGVIDKTTCLIMLLGGSGIMFVGSMIRSFSMVKK